MTSPKQHPALTPHNHQSCVDNAMVHAENISKNKKVQLTPVRRRALEILLENHRAVGAYDLAERLGAAGLGGQPVVAYRALDFLMKHGLVHKIQGLNAYVACVHSGQSHVPAFMVCDTCHTVAEAAAAPVEQNLIAVAMGNGFQISHTIVEAHGTCATCIGAQT